MFDYLVRFAEAVFTEMFFSAPFQAKLEFQINWEVRIND